MIPKLHSVVLSLLFTGFYAAAQESCLKVTSAVEDPTGAQIAGAQLPEEHRSLVWTHPATNTYIVNFKGIAGQYASHEGVDYVHNYQATKDVWVKTAGSGQVVYVREGCPQSSEFNHNVLARECGAGWGNHVVVKHGDQLYTRYAHLKPGSVKVEVGDYLQVGELLALMGNSGRSETRHLHFELGTKSAPFDACGLSQNFDAVYDPNLLDYKIISAVSELDANEGLIKIKTNHFTHTIEFEFAVELGVVELVSVFDLSGQVVSRQVNPVPGLSCCASTSNRWGSPALYIVQIVASSKTFQFKVVV